MERVVGGAEVEYVGNTKPEWKGLAFTAVDVDQQGRLVVHTFTDQHGVDHFYSGQFEEFRVAKPPGTLPLSGSLPKGYLQNYNVFLGWCPVTPAAAPSRGKTSTLCHHPKETRKLLTTSYLYCPICDVSEDLK